METNKKILLYEISPQEFKELLVQSLIPQIEIIIKKFISQEPAMYSVKSVADLLGRSELTIYNYIKRGTLPASKIGRKYIIHKTDLESAFKEVRSMKYKR
ncbi:helix-turn-helix domain-containing protein [Aestuariivivens marinum]|uniref:helix-turn-helix domain-containing protein n=1 Tax=Aestuariivivens marinum TaxID=2913555 RepID=UPI001F56AEC6|nr:helix-turn-helix domain-containing protein [Aestuariivivens marinum]